MLLFWNLIHNNQFFIIFVRSRTEDIGFQQEENADLVVVLITTQEEKYARLDSSHKKKIRTLDSGEVNMEKVD